MDRGLTWWTFAPLVEGFVQRQVGSCDASPAVAASRQRRGGAGELGSARRVGEQGGDGGAERVRVAGGDEGGGSGLGDLGEASDGGEDEGDAEAQRGEQDARLVDLAVGQDGEVGAAE